MGTRHLIDTNVVIDYLGNKLPKPSLSFVNNLIDDIPTLSVISKIELLGFNMSEAHYTLFRSFVNDSVVVGLNEHIVEQCIELRKNFKIKLPDAIIAATAICENLVLVTRNIADFNRIPNLAVVNPWEI